MNSHTCRTALRTVTTAALFGTVVIGAALVSPVTVAPATAVEAAGAPCAVTGGTFTWGVKESFRSYISSSIANGEWKATNGASYETPSFTFSEASGELDPATGAGTVNFAGTVHFSGHEGVLNLTLSNPSVEFGGDGTARLLLDTTSNDAQGEVTIDEKQATIGKVTEVPGLGSGEITSYQIDAAPAILTADGAQAFSGFYATGEALDPVSVSLELADCAATGEAVSPEIPVPPTAEQGSAESGSETPASAPAVPWIPIAVGGAALVVIAVAATLLITGRKKAAPAEGPTPDSAEGTDRDAQ